MRSISLSRADRNCKEPRAILCHGLNRYEQRLNGRLLNELLDAYAQWRKRRDLDLRERAKKIPRRVRRIAIEEMNSRYDLRGEGNHHLRYLYDFLFETIRNDLEWIDEHQRRHAEFHNTLAMSPTRGEQRRVIIDHARCLGATKRGERRDESALHRWLDEDALNDRYVQLKGEHQLRIMFALDRIGHVTAEILDIVANKGDGHDQLELTWDRLGLGPLLIDILRGSHDSRIHRAALHGLRTSISRLAPEQGRRLLADQTLNYVLRVVDNDDLDVWLQQEALELLEFLDPKALGTVLTTRLRAPHRLPRNDETDKPSSAARDLRFARARVRRTNAKEVATIRPLPADDIFVRRFAVRQFIRALNTHDDPHDVIEKVMRDPSDFVRQALADGLWDGPHDMVMPYIRELALQDAKQQVRAAAIVGALRRAGEPIWDEPICALLALAMQQEKSEFVLRTVLHVIKEWLHRRFQLHERADEQPSRHQSERHTQRLSNDTNSRQVWGHIDRYLSGAIETLRTNSKQIPVRRWAAQTAEHLWLARNTGYHDLYRNLRGKSRRLKNGESCWIGRKAMRGVNHETLGRLLALLSQDDYGHDVVSTVLGPRLLKGTLFGTRCWRIWYEMRNPSPDKRQAFRHTIGRLSPATVRAPSQIMAELSPTKVPGEPLFMPDEGGWRPYLPLVDDFVSALNLIWLWPRPVKFYTSEGVTEIRPSHNPWLRLRARWSLITSFARYAQLRNWTSQQTSRPTAFIEAMKQLGFQIQFRPYATQEECGDTNPREDETVIRFFPALAALAPWTWASPIGDTFARFQSYFSSIFENTLPHLLLFVVMVLILFLGKQAIALAVIRRARREIPLTLGGWGTRGKSGTERLKSALIVGLGHGLISKTTGCEATFIYSPPFGEPTEVPLFRPYDRATIWEHTNVLRMAAKFRPSVFLWECMGLVPEYVRILQRQWSRDDLSTVTNTYPDHEDLQGPAGYNVAMSIGAFVPRRGRLVTTEVQMRPILSDACRDMGTSLRGVGWLESGLITDDILSRFSYNEHPDNIALVTALAEEMGCSYEFALKTMADYLVPDLGVLKTYPASDIGWGHIEFTNGMSANERFGCLGNWKRTGFEVHSPYSEPGTWISTVVNNRSDRVARSRVFASILVSDLEADRHFLIGDNLEGLRGYVADAWQEESRSWRLTDEKGAFSVPHALKMLDTIAKRLRQPMSPQHLQDRISVLCEGLPANSGAATESLMAFWSSAEQLRQSLEKANIESSLVERIGRWHTEWLTAWQEYQELQSAIKQGTSSNAAEVETLFQQKIREWFDRKFVTIADYHATGEQIIHRIIEETPPGMLHRVMGIQNIKGPGLDFVYRFQDWDTCYHACRALQEPDVARVERGLRLLNALPQLGQLCQRHVLSSIQAARRLPTMQRADFQSQLDAIAAKLESSQADIQESLVESRPKHRRGGQFGAWLTNLLEQYFDVNDATRRRQQADQIYRDLREARISRQQAIKQLRYLSKRQKGGWLFDSQGAAGGC